MLRTALEALTFRLDGSRAAASTIIRKRAVLHGALGYAAESGLLPDNPLDSIGWQVPQSSPALDPAVVASPAQVSALLDAVARTRPEMTAFFGCLYYAALRPEEAVALRLADCHLPGSGWGMLRLARPRPGPPPPGPAAAPATSSVGSSTGRTGRSGWSRSLRCWSPCSARTTRPTAPRPTADCSGEPAAGRSANRSTAAPGTPPARSPSGPELAASGLARRPYDLRHAALSLWLNAGGDPAQIAARAGNSVTVPLTVYSHCIHGHDDLLNQQIGRALGPPA